MFQVKNLTKIYGTQRAVDAISFEAKEGEVLGFLGPNGAGKSTTMKIATGYIPPTAGTVEVCGYDITKSSLEVRRNVGYLPEHNPLYLDMYVHEYLEFVGAVYNIHGGTLRKRIDEVIEMTGLGIEQGKKIGALSKGYRQRVGLAQVLVHNPKVLILDEPTTGLDPNQIVEIRNLIRNIGREKTVIFSTHIMQEVEAICDRVVIINKGKIVADSDIAQLQRNHTLTVVVAEFDQAIDEQLLLNLPGVTAVTKIGGNKYSITSTSGKDLRAAVFQLAARNNIALIGLQQEENSLEQVFRQLTK